MWRHDDRFDWVGVEGVGRRVEMRGVKKEEEEDEKEEEEEEEEEVRLAMVVVTA